MRVDKREFAEEVYIVCLGQMIQELMRTDKREFVHEN